MTFDESEQAINEANQTLRMADRMADKLAHLLINRLRKVSSSWVLQELKRELKDFNAHTGYWKS